MGTRALSADRPTPALRLCDGVPWPTSEELDDEAAWAGWLDLGAPLPYSGDSFDTPWPDDGSSLSESSPPVDAPAASHLDSVLGHLELIAAERHRLAAEEGRMIAAVLRDAAADPTPWVGPDPTLDLAWNDARGRTVGAVRRDRVDLAQRAAAAEIAVRLRLSEQTVRARATRIDVLQERCPRVWTAFTDGRTSERHAVETARLAASLPADESALSAFDDGAVDAATRLVPTKFAVAARALRERVHAESIDVRHRRAARDRGVWMTPELDGMATLSALLPADRARGILTRLDGAARHLHAAPDEDRTLAQLRADVLADLVISPSPATPADGSDTTHAPAHRSSPPQAPPAPPTTGYSASPPPPDMPPAGVPHPRSTVSCALGAAPTPPAEASLDTAPAPPADTSLDPAPPPKRRRPAPSSRGPTVVVTVPALTLLGADDAPATLEGYGPIDLDTARRLAGESSSWVRLLTHPVTGAPLVLDRQTYRVPVALRRWLGVASPTCAFPGCARATRDCDIDHLTAWVDGGTTDADNLAPECRHHHRLRHGTGWTPAHDPESGAMRWASPLGGTYDTDPPPF